MTKTKKRITLIILSLCLILFACGAINAINDKASANSDNVFSEVTPLGASIRLNDPTGIRFESTLSEVDAQATYGYAIVPEYYLTDNEIKEDYIPALINRYGENGIILLESLPVEKGEDHCIRGSVSKILYENMNITYAGIPYKKVNSSYYYGSKPYIKSSVLDVATSALNDYHYGNNQAEYDTYQISIIEKFLNSALNKKAGVLEENNESTTATRTLTIDQTKKVSIGQSATISCNTAFNPDLILWESSDATVATVEKGVVTAKSSGTAIITAKVAGVSSECEITVPDGDLATFDTADYIDKVSLNTPSTKAVEQSIVAVSVLDSVTFGGITEYGVLKVDIYSGHESSNNANEQVNLVVGLMESHSTSGYTIRWAVDHPTYNSNIGSIKFSNENYAQSNNYSADGYINFQGDTMVEMKTWNTTYVGGTAQADAVYMQFHGQGLEPNSIKTSNNLFTVYLARVKDGNSVLGEDIPSSDINLAGRPVYGAIKDMRIMSYVSPNFKDQMLDDYVDAGFNAYTLTEDFAFMNQIYETALKNCADRDIDVFIRSFDAFNNSTYPYYGTDNRYIDTLNFDLRDYDIIKGVYMWDEPTANDFEEISRKIVPWWNEKYAATETFLINLLPSYAGSRLGVTEDEYVNGSQYQGYVTKYVNEVLSKVNGDKVLSLDHYPLRYNDDGEFLTDNYLHDLAVVSKAAHELDDCTFMTYIQAYKADGITYPSTKSEIAFQLNTSLAFGAKQFDFYRYLSMREELGIVQGGWDYNSCIKGDLYYSVKEALGDLHFLDDVYMHFDWKGVKTYLGATSYSQTAFNNITDFTMSHVPGIKSLTSSQDTLLGYYKDARGRNGYLAVNYTMPSRNAVNQVTMSFDKAYNKALVYTEGDAYTYNVVDGKIDLTLSPGESAFVIPYSNDSIYYLSHFENELPRVPIGD